MLDVSMSDHTLAVWGAVTGTVGRLGGGIALFNQLRERPRLRLLVYTQMRGAERELVMTVVNHGRRPAVICRLGLRGAFTACGSSGSDGGGLPASPVLTRSCASNST